MEVFIAMIRYKTVKTVGSAEFVEKKSRFIVTVIPVTTTQEALEELEKLRKEYWNATHNCFAYVLGDNGSEQRCSDDGEPSGTAGKPMIDVILGSKINNVLVVVTRYYGGTQLGTGGLVRAYSHATKLGLDGCVTIEKELGKLFNIRTDYNGIGKIQYILGEHQVQITNSDYTDIVNVEAMVPLELVDTIKNKITEATSGRAEIQVNTEQWFAILEGELMLF